MSGCVLQIFRKQKLKRLRLIDSSYTGRESDKWGEGEGEGDGGGVRYVDGLELLQREIDILKSISHANVVRLHEVRGRWSRSCVIE